jgi:serine protease Do
MITRPLLALGLMLLLVGLCSEGVADTVKDREGAVRGDKEAMEKDARWIYNDVDQGFAEAKRTGRPLLVVLRCVPCLSCAGIDASVLAEPSLTPWLDKFVCVRIINANALDLQRFQFDYDLSFSTMFFNGDGTIYGRYGSWTHQKDPKETSTAGYLEALKGAVKLHEGYPKNNASLAGKQGGAIPYKTPLEIPLLTGKFSRDLDWQGKVVQSCVHCHQIGDAFRESFRRKREPIPDQWIYPQPGPETLGIKLVADQAASVSEVMPDSIATRSGLKVGDRILTFAGQPLLSPADLCWVLHRAESASVLPIVVERAGKEVSLTVNLPLGWRQLTDISKRVGTWQMRGMATGGLVLEDLAAPEREQRKLEATKLALFVKFVGQYNQHAAAKKAGFQKEDIIIALDGKSERLTEGQLMGKLLQTKMPGEKVSATVLRGTETLELMLPMQ